MKEFCDIIMALIEQAPWIASIIITYIIYKANPGYVEMSIMEKVKFISKR